MKLAFKTSGAGRFHLSIERFDAVEAGIAAVSMSTCDGHRRLLLPSNVWAECDHAVSAAQCPCARAHSGIQRWRITSSWSIGRLREQFA